MYHIVAEAKIRDARRAAREWTEERAGHVIRQNNQPIRILKTVQRFAASTLSFLA